MHVKTEAKLSLG